MHTTLKYLAAMASCVLFATSASAQSATDIRDPSPDQATAHRDGERRTRKRLAAAAMGPRPTMPSCDSEDVARAREAPTPRK
jgi:hypothetical protein